MSQTPRGSLLVVVEGACLVWRTSAMTQRVSGLLLVQRLCSRTFKTLTRTRMWLHALTLFVLSLLHSPCHSYTVPSPSASALSDTLYPLPLPDTNQ